MTKNTLCPIACAICKKCEKKMKNPAKNYIPYSCAFREDNSHCDRIEDIDSLVRLLFGDKKND